ncbi:MAG: chorismate-binding protein, partial [Bacteroidota bacterium]
MNAEYAFACWRMPKEDKEILIVSMEPPQQTGTDVSSLDSGFLINKFSDNHPGKPYLIKADIIFEGDEVKLDPRVNASVLDRFESKLKTSRPGPKKSIGPVVKVADTFRASVMKAIREIRSNAMDKVVLSRFKEVRLPANFSADLFFKDLTLKYPNAFCNIVFLPSEGLWMGATPELLLSDNQASFRTHALAGT